VADILDRDMERGCGSRAGDNIRIGLVDGGVVEWLRPVILDDPSLTADNSGGPDPILALMGLIGLRPWLLFATLRHR
jgi:hypothetical protein